MNAPQMRFLPGLTSITFRKLSPNEVIAEAAAAGLRGIEWGGDIHVPIGDVDNAARVGAATRDAGLDVASYGSYYRVGASPPEEGDAVVQAAIALGAPIVRVWVGAKGSAETNPDERAAIVADARRIADLAADANIRIASEWHGGTLTDTLPSALALLSEVDHPAWGTYWQPRAKQPPVAYSNEIAAILPRLLGLHVFQWDSETGARQLLADGDALWPDYFQQASEGQAQPMYALIEFVRDDALSAFRDDAVTLRRWLEACN